MARWKLTEPHYLSVPSERWEHTTNDARTGKPVRKMYKVPKHLDPRIEDDWNVRINGMDGEIHVCYEGKGFPTDIVFEGNPTPGMLPLDEEARDISAQFSWTPTEGIDEESQRKSFYARLSDTMINQLTDLKATTAMTPQTQGLDKLLEAMAALMAQNQQILTMLLGKAPVVDELERQARELGETKAVFEEEPLEDVEPTKEEIALASVAAAEKESASQSKAINRMTSKRL
jgi:hypothetical protein